MTFFDRKGFMINLRNKIGKCTNTQTHKRGKCKKNNDSLFSKDSIIDRKRYWTIERFVEELKSIKKRKE